MLRRRASSRASLLLFAAPLIAACGSAPSEEAAFQESQNIVCDSEGIHVDSLNCTGGNKTPTPKSTPTPTPVDSGPPPPACIDGGIYSWVAGEPQDSCTFMPGTENQQCLAAWNDLLALQAAGCTTPGEVVQNAGTSSVSGFMYSWCPSQEGGYPQGVPAADFPCLTPPNAVDTQLVTWYPWHDSNPGGCTMGVCLKYGPVFGLNNP